MVSLPSQNATAPPNRTFCLKLSIIITLSRIYNRYAMEHNIIKVEGNKKKSINFPKKPLKKILKNFVFLCRKKFEEGANNICVLQKNVSVAFCLEARKHCNMAQIMDEKILVKKNQQNI